MKNEFEYLSDRGGHGGRGGHLTEKFLKKKCPMLSRVTAVIMLQFGCHY